MRTLLHSIAKKPEVINTSENHVVDLEQLLAKINTEEVYVLYPLIVFYAIILVIGVIGNSLVLLVYSFRYKQSPARVYILFLASIDFSICLFGLPYHLIDLMHPYNFTDAITCKTLTFVITTLFHMSIFGLIVISIDRYLKICKPLEQVQLSYFGKKRSIVGAVVAAVLLSWPNIILYGRSEVVTPHANVTGYSCFFDSSYENTNYPFIYIMVTLCVCLLSTVFLTIAYSLICHQIFTRYQTKKIPFSEIFANDDTTLASLDVNLRSCSIPDYSKELKSNVSESAQSAHASQSDIINRTKGNPEKCSRMDINSADSIYKHHPVTAKYSSNDGSLIYTDDQCIFNNMNKAGNCRLHSMSATGSNDDVIEPFAATISDNIVRVNQNSNLLGRITSARDVNLDPKTTYDDSILGAKNERLIADLRFVPSTYKENMRAYSSVVNSLSNIYPIEALQKSFQMVCNESSNSVYSTSSFDATSRISYKKSIHKALANLKLKNTRPESRYNCRIPAECGVSQFEQQRSFRRSSDQTGVSSNHITKCKQWERTFVEKQRHSWATTENAFLRINTSRDHIATTSSTGAIKHKNVISKQHFKITKIMFTVTLIFILSYTPALIVTIWTILQPNVWDILDDNETILFEFFLRFYLVNNICNPFIYGFWDKRFKREVMCTFSKLSRLFSDRCGCCNNSNR